MTMPLAGNMSNACSSATWHSNPNHFGFGPMTSNNSALSPAPQNTAFRMSIPQNAFATQSTSVFGSSMPNMSFTTVNTRMVQPSAGEMVHSPPGIPQKASLVSGTGIGKGNNNFF